MDGDFEYGMAKREADEGELYMAKTRLGKLLYKYPNHTEAKLLLNEIEARLANGEEGTVYTNKQQIKSLLIWSIIGTVIGIIIDISIGNFGFTWIGCGLGCAADNMSRHASWHNKHEKNRKHPFGCVNNCRTNRRACTIFQENEKIKRVKIMLQKKLSKKLKIINTW
jgi:hypothetical protein